MTVHDDAHLAADLVREAAALAARLRAEARAGADLAISTKTGAADVVTAADHAAEALVVGRLRAERPDDAIVGEEGTNFPGTSGRRWVVDPVDGTWNFASGSDYWCSAMALLDGEDPVLGAVAHYATGEVIVGGPQWPSTLNGLALPALDPEADPSLHGAATYLHPGWVDDPRALEPFLRAARVPATLRMLGSGSMDLVGVATGRLGLWFQHSTPSWDWYPGAAIVAGLGGTTVRVAVEDFTWSVAGGRRGVEALVSALTGQA